MKLARNSEQVAAAAAAVESHLVVSVSFSGFEPASQPASEHLKANCAIGDEAAAAASA